MDCSRARIEISSRIDGSLDPRIGRQLDLHLEACASCRAFEAEQLELAGWLAQQAPQLDVPAHLWGRIEARLAPEPVPALSRWQRLIEELSLPQFRYVAASLVLLLAGSLAFLFWGSPADSQPLLTRLDAVTLTVPENPFLEALGEGLAPLAGQTGEQNPFRDLEARP